MDASEFLQRYERGERKFTRVNLAGADLSGKDLSAIKLTYANLNGASLYSANLSNAKLSHADLSRANLRDANLSAAELSDANLSKADLSGADLKKADLYGANLRWADLSYADLSGANLATATLYCANLTEAKLGGASLYGATLRWAHLANADLSGANLSSASLQYANLGLANLSNADFSGAKLTRSNLAYAKLAGADLRRADCSDVNIAGADFTGAKLERFNLEGGILNQVNPVYPDSAIAEMDEGDDFGDRGFFPNLGANPSASQIGRETLDYFAKYLPSQGREFLTWLRDFFIGILPLYGQAKPEKQIAQALDRAGALFYFRGKARLNTPRGRGECETDFLICHGGKWGILQIENGTSETKSDRDRFLKAHGIHLVAHYDAELCNERPDSVVREFLTLLESSEK